MPSRWFRTKEIGEGTVDDSYGPDLKGHDLSYSGNKDESDNSLIWYVKVYGTEAELDSLASEAGVTELSNVPKQALDGILGQGKTEAEWDNSIRVDNQ